MTKGILVAIFGAFAPMSVLMFGGANSIIPELHRQVVDVHAWMSSEEFATLFAVAQARTEHPHRESDRVAGSGGRRTARRYGRD